MTDKPQSDNPEPKPEAPSSSEGSFWTELKRRKVMRVAITYGVVAWLLIQVSATVFPMFDIPVWAGRLVALVLVIGFPVAIILAWAFELSPDGIKTTKSARIENPDPDTDSTAQKKRNWMAFAFAAAVPTLIFGALAVFFFFSRSAPESSDVTSPEKSIAVLPFANRSANDDDAFFTDGIHDDLLTHISRIKDIKTIARTSVMGYRDTTKKMSAIGVELGVSWLLEGGVQRGGNQIRVNVQLIDAATEGHLWAEIYTREMTAGNIFEIQTEIATAITKELKAVLSPEEQEDLAKLPTTNLAALEAYFKGNQAEYPPTVHGLANAIRFYDEALELDPNFADAHAHKAMALFQQLRTGTVVFQARSLMDTHLQKAMELNPNLSVAHHLLAEISSSGRNRDIEEAAKFFQRAIDLDPANTRAAIGYSQFISDQVGDATAAAALLQRSLEIDPNGSFAKVGAAIQAAQAGRINEARGLYKQAVADDPANPDTLRSLAGFYYEYESRLDEAIIASRKAFALDPLNRQIARRLSSDYEILGDLDQAVFWSKRVVQLSSNPNRPNANNSDNRNESPEARIQKILDRYEKSPPGDNFDMWLLLKHDIATGQPEKSLVRYQETYPQFFVEDPVVTGGEMFKAKDAARALMACGFREQGLKLIDRVLEVIESMEAKRNPLLVRAMLYAIAEREPEAIEAINDFFNGGGFQDRILPQDEFDSLKDNPEFQAIVAREEAKLKRQRDRIAAMEAAGELAPIPPLPEKTEAKL